jgi:hypothetical protein
VPLGHRLDNALGLGQNLLPDTIAWYERYTIRLHSLPTMLAGCRPIQG